MAFTQQISADGHLLRVTLAGEMDFSVAVTFEVRVRRLLITRRPRVIQLDLAGLHFIDSTAVSVIVRLWRMARREHCTVRVVNSTGMVRQVLDVTGALALVGAGPAPETSTA